VFHPKLLLIFSATFHIQNRSGHLPAAVVLRYEIFNLRVGIRDNSAASTSKIINLSQSIKISRLPIYSIGGNGNRVKPLFEKLVCTYKSHRFLQRLTRTTHKAHQVVPSSRKSSSEARCSS
jgi:hypothetical protein